MIRAGNLTHRITIERNTPTTVLGEVTDSWATLASRRAQKEAVGASEVFGSDVRYAESQYVYTLRYDPTTSTITTRDRVLEGTAVYGIDGAIDPDGKKREVQLFVTRLDDG